MEGCFISAKEIQGAHSWFYTNQLKPHWVASSQCDLQVTVLRMYILLPAPRIKSRPRGCRMQALPCPLVSQIRNKICSWLVHLGHLNTLHPAPLLLHESWWQSEHMIMSLMCLRLLSQHCCRWSHSKSGWFLQQMDLTINFFTIKISMAKWVNLGTGLLIQPLIFHIPYSKGRFSLCPSHFRSAPWAVGRHLRQGSLTATHVSVILQTHGVCTGFASF